VPGRGPRCKKAHVEHAHLGRCERRAFPIALDERRDWRGADQACRSTRRRAQAIAPGAASMTAGRLAVAGGGPRGGGVRPGARGPRPGSPTLGDGRHRWGRARRRAGATGAVSMRHDRTRIERGVPGSAAKVAGAEKNAAAHRLARGDYFSLSSAAHDLRQREGAAADLGVRVLHGLINASAARGSDRPQRKSRGSLPHVSRRVLQRSEEPVHGRLPRG
jgi:hypothetical protein